MEIRFFYNINGAKDAIPKIFNYWLLHMYYGSTYHVVVHELTYWINGINFLLTVGIVTATILLKPISL